MWLRAASRNVSIAKLFISFGVLLALALNTNTRTFFRDVFFIFIYAVLSGPLADFPAANVVLGACGSNEIMR